jgi:glycerol 2-dehydrogenase (NADP+)
MAEQLQLSSHPEPRISCT